MLTAAEARRAGFLLRCAEEGLTQEQIDARLAGVEALAKQAVVPILEDVLRAAKSYPLSALGAGILGGATLGGAWGLATPEDVTKAPRPAYVGDVQQAELISTYRQQAEQLRRQAEMARRRKARLAVIGRSPYGV